MPKLPWFDRTFSFDFPVETYPDVVERFRGTPARIEDKVRGLSRDTLTRSDGGWSIQENIGHLIELDAIFDGRIEDYIAGLPELRPADITNKATHEGQYNLRDISQLLKMFRARRERAVNRLGSLTDADFARVSIHPRLKTSMRLIDAIAFVCAHDDYHLARMTELVKKFGGV